MRDFLLALALFTAFFSTFTTTARAEALDPCTCEIVDEGTKACVRGYCIYPGTNPDVLYYFHGAGGTLGKWAEKHYYTSQLREEWARRHRSRPTVVAVSYGPAGMLAPKNASPISGNFENFEQRMRPEIERKLPRKIRRRLLLGESMGAFNVAQLALRTNHYEKAAALCAVLHEKLGPHASQEEILAAVRASRARQSLGPEAEPTMLERISQAIGMARLTFPSPADWALSDPFHLAETSRARPAIYLAAGLRDVFANYEGNEAFARKLRRLGYPVEWRPQWGGHCAVDLPSLARFLTH
jgi:hypothetical protein